MWTKILFVHTALQNISSASCWILCFCFSLHICALSSAKWNMVIIVTFSALFLFSFLKYHYDIFESFDLRNICPLILSLNFLLYATCIRNDVEIRKCCFDWTSLHFMHNSSPIVENNFCYSIVTNIVCIIHMNVKEKKTRDLSFLRETVCRNIFASFKKIFIMKKIWRKTLLD